MAVRTCVKIAAHAERFWCEVLERNEDGSMKARVDSPTKAPNPLYNEIITIPADEWIYETMSAEFH